ncbi:MAG: HU family DNA-binding protein [Polyangiaceae bacterium]|nr:HU family DNA-binding protein [Polyangiaceae bacterium]MBK8941932.1 HU family DNA-binding protein [Polyangiaceae bacterium]
MPGASKMTKAQFVAAVAEKAGLDKRQVTAVFDALASVIKDELGPSGPGELTIMNLLKLKVKVQPATPESEGINPFTKEKQIKKAKPASRKVKATPVKGLKDLVAG